MKGKGMALMIAIGKKKPSDGYDKSSEEMDDSPPSSESSSEELKLLTKSFFEAGSKGKYKLAAQAFHEMQKYCSDMEHDSEEEE